MNTAFEARQLRKTYHAIVVGSPPWMEYLADLPLKVDSDRRHRTAVSFADGKPSRTQFRVITSNGSFSLVEARPLTGYTHQIRAHLLNLGFPILADPLYTFTNLPPQKSPAIQPPIDRLALHAFSLVFQHPITGIELQLTAPYPEDFNHALVALSLTL